jgi:hypothetical protein
MRRCGIFQFQLELSLYLRAGMRPQHFLVNEISPLLFFWTQGPRHAKHSGEKVIVEIRADERRPVQ